jgi:hypothetical protein
MKKFELRNEAVQENRNVSPTVARLQSLYKQALREDQPFHKLKEIKTWIRIVESRVPHFLN